MNFINILFQKKCLVPLFMVFTKTIKKDINYYIIFLEKYLVHKFLLILWYEFYFCILKAMKSIIALHVLPCRTYL